MAFSSAVTSNSVYGNHRIIFGTYTNTNTDSGGAITTGLSTVFGFHCIPTSGVDETMPKYSASGGTVTLTTNNGSAGNWYALGL